MKNVSVFSLLLLGITIILSPQLQTAQGQSSDKIAFYVDAGAGIPAGPSNFTQNWNIGYGLGAGVSYQIQPWVKLQLFGQYHRFNFDEGNARNNVNVSQDIRGIEGADANMFSVMLNVIYEYTLPGSLTSTYFTVGGGYLRAGRSDFTIKTSQKDITIDQNSGSTLAVNGGVGLRRALSRRLSLYVEAKFVTGLFVDNRTQYVPISVGISF